MATTDTTKKKKKFSMLENNPEVMNAFATHLGLKSTLRFHEVYSLDDPDLLALIPRPVHALLVIIPMTPLWHARREAEDHDKPSYDGAGAGEPIIWFRQDIGHACGSIGALHCFINGEPAKHIVRGSALEKLRSDAIPPRMEERAQMLHDSPEFEEAHRSVEQQGSSRVLPVEEQDRLGQHFVAFVKGNDGHLWELEGSRKGPLNRGKLDPAEDVLSPRALDAGIRGMIRNEVEGGGKDLRFSCLALCVADGT